MSSSVDVCPACNAFVRNTWVDVCGACGALLWPEPERHLDDEDQVDSPGDKVNKPLLIAAIVLAVVICAGGIVGAGALSGADDKKPELASVGASMGEAITVAGNPLQGAKADTPATTAAAAPVTTAPVKPAVPDIDVLKAAADKSSKVKSFDFDATITVGSSTITETGSFNSTTGLFSATVDGAGIDSIYMVVDLKKDLVYMKLPENLQAEAGKPWAKVINADELNLDVNEVTNSSAFTSAARNVRKVTGVSIVDGVTTTRYRFDVDSSVYKKSPQAAEQVKKIIDMYGSAEMTGEVAIDGDGNIRQYVLELDMGMAGTFTMTQTLKNLNNAGKITMPPANQISTKVLDLGK